MPNYVYVCVPHPPCAFLVAATVDGIQVLVNLKFIKVLVAFLRDSTAPLTRGTLKEGEEEMEEEEDERKRGTALYHQVSTMSRSQSRVEEGKESRINVSAKVFRPLVALLEDAQQMDSAALVCQVSS